MATNKKIVITGGSGFIGNRLTAMLLQQGYRVEHLGRSANSRSGVKTRLWNPDKRQLDPRIFDTLTNEELVIVHLAGEGIADQRWTSERKQSIISSRTSTIRFLYDELNKRNVKVSQVVSAGGSGFYGAITTDQIFREEDQPHNDFIAHSCIEWEKAVLSYDHSVVAVLRTPLVLDRYEGGLPKISRPIEFGIAMALGSGKQWMPWVHWKDLCRAYIHVMENNLGGIYNVAAPTHINNLEFIRSLASIHKVPFFLPNFPEKLLRLMLGELAVLVTTGSRIDASKLRNTGFSFDYQTVDQAFDEIYGK